VKTAFAQTSNASRIDTALLGQNATTLQEFVEVKETNKFAAPTHLTLYDKPIYS
jgi:hypothetical protein